jgi:hypothetical protein
MSLSPCVDVPSCGKDIGDIMRSLNIGDGHQGAGAGRISCGSKSEMLRQKEQTLRRILQLWNRG